MATTVNLNGVHQLSLNLLAPVTATVSAGVATITETLTGTAGQVYAAPAASTGSFAPRALVPSDLPVATTSALGAVKPDGTSITITAGVITAVPINFADNEVPGGTPNGSLTSFTLAHTPNPATSLRLYDNGMRLYSGTDYTLSGNTITTLYTPASGHQLLSDYRF